MYKVMIVDDEPFAREGIVHDINWDSLDFTVCAVAKDGLQALEKYQETSPDLIISDINMPMCNGIEMLQRLRDQGSDIQIIFLTAYSEFDYARDALRLYAADYILKPFEDGTIETSVQKIIPKLVKTKTPQAINDTNRYVKKAIEYIKQNYANPNLSIYEIASHLEISEGHISRLFHKETSYTLAGYITSIRLEKAKNLLCKHNCRISEAAEQTGYTSVAYFSSLFKKRYGITPSEYQNQNL